MKSLFLALSAAAVAIFAQGTLAAVRYVNVNNPTPVAPYTSWATAATNIQDAVDLAVSGEEVVVTNGVYQTGGRVVNGALMNRVAVTTPITVRSVNGPAVTTIQGVPAIGDGAVRCAYLTNGALMAGFTLTSGGTRGTGDDGTQQSGGAVWGESTSAVASNCVITSSSSGRWGGGAAFLTLLDCVITGNYAGHGGGAFVCALTNCVLTNNSSYYGGAARDSDLDHCAINGNVSYSNGGGTVGGTLTRCGLTNNTCIAYSAGGALYGTLNGCILVGNSSVTGGGGASESTLINCLLMGNTASSGGGAAFGTLINCVVVANSCGNGGGAEQCTLNNCLLSGNSASEGGGGAVGSTLNNCTVVTNSTGADYCTVNNCILYYNTYGDYSAGTISYCCASVLPDGPGNFTNAPQFLNLAAGDFRLQSGSPCVNAGYNAYVPGTTDLEGNARIAGGTVDVGAYEFQGSTSLISHAWLLQYGLPTDGSADLADPDGDGLNNWQEWIAGTVPTDATSSLRLLNPALPSVTLRWLSVTNRMYFVDRAASLQPSPSFSTVASNIPGQPGVTTFTDASAPGPGPFFYRVGVCR